MSLAKYFPPPPPMVGHLVHRSQPWQPPCKALHRVSLGHSTPFLTAAQGTVFLLCSARRASPETRSTLYMLLFRRQRLLVTVGCTSVAVVLIDSLTPPTYLASLPNLLELPATTLVTTLPPPQRGSSLTPVGH